MESAITAIISGFFVLLAVFLKDYLDTRRDQRRWAEAHPGKPIPPLQPAESDRWDSTKIEEGDNKTTAPLLDGPVAKARFRVSFAFLSGILAIGAVTSVALAWIDIETILGTLPFLSIVGFLVAWLAKRNSTKIGLFTGLSPALVSMTCVGLIWLFSWGPSDASMPIAVLMTVYTIAFLPLLAFATRRGLR